MPWSWNPVPHDMFHVKTCVMIGKIIATGFWLRVSLRKLSLGSDYVSWKMHIVCNCAWKNKCGQTVLLGMYNLHGSTFDQQCEVIPIGHDLHHNSGVALWNYWLSCKTWFIAGNCIWRAHWNNTAIATPMSLVKLWITFMLRFTMKWILHMIFREYLSEYFSMNEGSDVIDLFSLLLHPLNRRVWFTP